MLHAIGGRHLVTFERLDHLEVVGGARALDGAQQFARRHVAVVGDVARHRDRRLRIGGLPALDELGDARQRQQVIPGGAEHAEQRLGHAPDVGPVLLVVDPGGFVLELEVAHLLAQRLEIVAADGGGDHVRLDLLHLQEIRREVARVLRDQQVVDDLAAGLLHLFLGGRRRGVAPHIVVGEQQPALADLLHRVLHGGLGEVGAVAVPHELHARAVLAGFARRGRVGVEIDGAVLVGDLGDGVGDARMQGAEQEAALLLGDEALGDARAGGRVGFGVGGDPLDLAADHAALGVELVDRQTHAAQVVLAAVAVLAAGVAGEAELDRLGALRPDAIVLPGAEECGRAAGCGGDHAALHRRAPGKPGCGFAWFLHRFLLLKSAVRPFDVGTLLGHRINILFDVVK